MVTFAKHLGEYTRIYIKDKDKSKSQTIYSLRRVIRKINVCDDATRPISSNIMYMIWILIKCRQGRHRRRRIWMSSGIYSIYSTIFRPKMFALYRPLTDVLVRALSMLFICYIFMPAHR